MGNTVSRLTTVAYAAPALVLAMLGVTFYVLLPKYYTDVVGIDGKVLGIIILASRIWDAVLDPMLGWLSDRTRSRWGRRRPWIAAGALPLAILFLCLTAVQPWTSPVIWVGASTFLFFLFWTAVSVPYQSLGAELSFSYNERTKVLAVRDGALVVGTLLAVVIPELLRSAGYSQDSARFPLLGILYGVLLLAAIAVCVRFVKEREWSLEQRPRGSLFSNARSVLENRPFLILLIAYVIGGFGSQLPSTLFLYFVQYVLRSDKGPLFLLLYFAVGFSFLPFWVWLCARIGKKEGWIAAMAVNAGSFVGVLFLGPGDTVWYAVIVFLSGIGYGAVLAIPSSMQADVIDFDEFRTGRRREGQITGFWLVANKLAAALGAGIALPLIFQAGYHPGAVQDDATVWMIKFLYGGVPCLCYGIAIAVAAFYPITKSSYERMRGQLKGASASEG